MAIKTFTCFGDSLTEGTAFQPGAYYGGSGQWVETIAEWMNILGNWGPLISSGMIPTYQAYWAKTGTFTALTTSNAWDKMPYSAGFTSNGQANTWTFTYSNRLRTPVGFAIYWTDWASGGDWQYRVDGGSWVNMGQTRAGDNKLAKFYVSGAVTSTIDFRGYNGSSDVGMLINGVEIYYLAPTTTTGFIVHNLGHNGDVLHGLTVTGSADQMAIVDDVKLGTGSPNSPYPTEGCIVMHLNDVRIYNDTTQWANDMTAFYNRCSPKGTVGFHSPWECSYIFYPSADQAAYRTQTSTTASSLGAKYLNHNIFWSRVNIITPTDSLNFGITGDGTHPTQSGQAIVAYWVWWWLLNNFFNIVPARSTYTTKAAPASMPVYKASKTAQQIKAFMPLGAR